MKFKFVNEGSRGEVDITFGGIKELDKLVDRYVYGREKLLLEEDDLDYVNEFMEIEFFLTIPPTLILLLSISVSNFISEGD